MATPFRSSPVLIMRSWAPGIGRRADAAIGVVWCGSIVAERSAADRRRHGGLCADDDHVTRESGEAFDATATGVEPHQVLDADAGLAGEVDPGFDGKHGRARERRLRCPLAQARQLVRREADAVARPVPELVAMAGLGDDVSGDAVDGSTARTRPR